jgi:deoxyribonuclease V
MACIRRLKLQPDVFLADGHGVAHPYRCGFASHLGLALSKPTIGVAKKRLIGDPVNAYMVDKNQIVGAVVSTRNNAKPVYVSIGHLVSLQKAIEIVEHCVRNIRIPEPLLQAHRIAASGKQAFLKRAKLQKI